MSAVGGLEYMAMVFGVWEQMYETEPARMVWQFAQVDKLNNGSSSSYTPHQAFSP